MQQVSLYRRKSIKQWAPDDRPREKLMNNGPGSLSNSELLAILLRTGTRSKSAVDLSREILELCQCNLGQLAKKSIGQLRAIKGMGESKAIILIAALELSRRKAASLPLEMPILNASNEVIEYFMAQFKDRTNELFAIMFLNQMHKVLKVEIISEGGITSTVVDSRIVIKKALEYNAVAMILCHNHPSGSTNPSRADIELTNRLTHIARLHDISILDHVIVSEMGYYSFADNGRLE